MIRSVMTGAVVAACLSLNCNAQVLPLDIASKLFGARQNTRNADLSPDGTKLVYIAAAPGAKSVAIVSEIGTDKKTALIAATGDPETLDRCDWVNDRWIICSFGGNIRYEGLLIEASRTILVDSTTGKYKSLSVRDEPNSARINQFDGGVIDWLPDDQGAVLMQRNHAAQGNAPSVDRVEVDPLKFRRIESPTTNVDYYLTDGHGDVRFAGLADMSAYDQLTGKYTYRYRTTQSRDWNVLPGQSEDFSPIRVDKATNSLYYRDRLDGRMALFRMPLDGSNNRVLVASHPKVDIDGTIVLYPGDPVVGYRYTDDRTHSVYTDPNIAKLAASLAKALPASPLISVQGASKDRNKLLIFASGDTDPGNYYVLDQKTRNMQVVAGAREALDSIPLAPVRSVSIDVQDGTKIPGYVTAVRDRPSTNQPVIIMPHGGPSSRDEWGFDWLAQFLALRGYTVIQPNYRGSDGYGSDFLGDNAFRGWKLAMSDIRGTADWAVKSGLADPNRMAILGWSYGGYAALQSASLDPRYKAVVAIAPVTDLGALRRDVEGFTNADLAKEEIGKGPHLKEGSPYNQADKIHAPVLLVHGDMDVNVRVAHSKRMVNALQKTGTPVQFLEYKNLDHYLEDSAAREEMLKAIGTLLDKSIGH